MASVSAARKEIGSPQRVLIALSGGADSVALFCMLKELSQQEHFLIAAVHVNHGLRDTADRDEQFCRQLCKDHDVPLYCLRVYPKSASEMDAREARYAAFANVYQQWQADVIALAHHLNDQAETVLMHLLRGSGSKGLCGMHLLSNHQSDHVIMQVFRPLLSFEKDVLISIATEKYGAYCHDETNDNALYTRNQFRLQLMPSIKKILPGAERALARTANILQVENDLLDSMTKDFLEANACVSVPVPFIKRPAFQELHLALRRRIMQHFLPFSEPYETIDQAAKIQPGACVNLQRGWHLRADEQLICLVTTHTEHPPISPLIVDHATDVTGDGKHSQRMPLAIYQACTLRYRMPGDFIQPFGMHGRKSLQDYMVDRKVSEPLRDYVPLLCMGSEVIWAIGIGASEKVRCNELSKQVLLTYTDRLPYEKR